MSAQAPGPNLSERVLRRIERLLDEADEAIGRKDWSAARESAQAVLALSPGNADAQIFLAAADRALAASAPGPKGEAVTISALAPIADPALAASPAGPASFANGRYEVVRFLGEGGKKRVYLAHDTKLDRDVAFALLKNEGLDEEGRARIRREAQAMARLGDDPHIVTVHDIGEADGQAYLVCQYMAGGDLEQVLAGAANHQLAIDQALQITDQICQALEHAHKQRIIHRDLKPGNIWLSGGAGDWGLGVGGPGSALAPPAPDTQHLTPIVAKLGDFGLAFALDHSRLTQAGMMVGTVAYIAPEQASGGTAGPRSDLYALGCTLYEMVCGRPPFVGDDSVAIIGQHLNTPPVDPSWHRPDCPPGLEALIRRLLEKDPAQRPASAAEVRKLLVSVATGAGAPTPTPPPTLGEGQGERASPAGAGPLYRPTFVGREHEVHQVRAAFDGATSGRGALMAVVGEPGIGKTALCEQLATYVGLRGGRVLVGHCYEEGSLSLPYLPFVEALRAYVLGQEPDRLKEELGTGAAEVARIVSEIRDRVPVEVRPAGDPDDDRWRLFQAVTGFLRNAGAVQPLVIVLEDLHWADRGTLELLLHVARNLQGARLLIVGTYRDVEVDRAHPLSNTLAELRRIGDFDRVLLRGLSVDDVQRIINTLQGQEIRWSFAEAVHRQTEGNPLFVQEVLRYLIEEGLIVRKEGRWEGRWRETGETPPEMSIPEGLRDVVGKRLSRLSERTNQVLTVASVVGRDFRLDVLQRVAGPSTGSAQALSAPEIEAALQEAKERAIVEERPALGVLAFRFTHAFFRQTLYEEIFAAQRLRLHQQVARALESLYSPGSLRGGEQGALPDRPAARTAGRLEEHASELAEHYAQSTDPADLEKALDYSELAAMRAMSVFAYGEATRHLEQALKIQDVLDPDDKVKRCDLLLTLGEAMLPMEEPRRVADRVAEEAFALAEAIDDSHRAARAAVQAIEAFMRTSLEGPMWRSPEVGEWVIRADRHAQVTTVERIYTDMAQGLRALVTVGPTAMHVFLRRAVERALDLGDNAAFFAAAAWALQRLNALRDRELQERLAREVLTHPHDGVKSRDLAQCFAHAGLLLLWGGDRELAEAAWREETRLAERTRDASLAVDAMDSQVMLALIDGRLDEAASIYEAQRAQGEQLGVSGGAPSHVATLHLLLGRTSNLLGMFGDAGRFSQATRAFILAHLGRTDEARAIREGFGDLGSHEDESATHILVQLLAASILGSDNATAESLIRRLAPLAGTVYRGLSIGRLLGDGARLLGRREEARGYYAQALDVCTKIRFRPEVALIRLALAELAVDELRGASSGSKGAAPETSLAAQDSKLETLREVAEHLDFAIEEFREMKMQPSLERALALKKSLGD